MLTKRCIPQKKFIMHFILTTDALLGLKNHSKKLLFIDIFWLNASLWRYRYGSMIILNKKQLLTHLYLHQDAFNQKMSRNKSFLKWFFRPNSVSVVNIKCIINFLSIYGFSPVCIFWCDKIITFWKKILLYCLQWYGFSPVYVCLCTKGLCLQ